MTRPPSPQEYLKNPFLRPGFCQLCRVRPLVQEVPATLLVYYCHPYVTTNYSLSQGPGTRCPLVQCLTCTLYRWGGKRNILQSNQYMMNWLTTMVMSVYSSDTGRWGIGASTTWDAQVQLTTRNIQSASTMELSTVVRKAIRYIIVIAGKVYLLGYFMNCWLNRTAFCNNDYMSIEIIVLVIW